MIKHIWSVLCRRSIVDSGSNNLTISDVLEELTVDLKLEKEQVGSTQTITIPLEFETVSFWIKEGDKSQNFKGESTVEVISPEGKALQSFKQLVNLPSDMKRLRTILRCMGLTLDNSGNYIIRVSLKADTEKDYKVVAELPLEVKLNKEILSKVHKS